MFTWEEEWTDEVEKMFQEANAKELKALEEKYRDLIEKKDDDNVIQLNESEEKKEAA